MPSLVGGYLAAVTLFMVFVLHLSVSPERFRLLMLIAALILGRAKRFLAEWIRFVVLFLSDEYLRGLSGKIGMPIHDVTSLERVVSFGQVPTLVLQQAFYHAGHLSWYDIAATMFYFLHFAFPLGLGYLFWVVDRRTFLRFSRALIAMSFAAFVFYLLLPVAPPWKAVPGVVKIIDHTLPSFTDIPGLPVPATMRRCPGGAHRSRMCVTPTTCPKRLGATSTGSPSSAVPLSTSCRSDPPATRRSGCRAGQR